MKRKYIPVEEAAKEWMKDPHFRAAYDALEEEFVLAEALIRARGEADMTQEDVASAMGTTQAAVARLESGRSLPSVDPHAQAFRGRNWNAAQDQLREAEEAILPAVTSSPV